jgi:hypothetical protein
MNRRCLMFSKPPADSTPIAAALSKTAYQAVFLLLGAYSLWLQARS